MPSVYYHTNDNVFNIEETIEKLKHVEGEPIRRYERDIKLKKINIDAFRLLLKDAKELRDAINQLYSFRAPFGKKKVNSSQPAAVAASVTDKKISGKRQLEVLQLAAAHSISSDAVADSDTLPAGSFKVSIADKSFTLEFGGGSMQSLADLLKEKLSEDFTVEIKEVGSARQIVMTAVKMGEKNRITLQDTGGVLQKAGFVKSSEKKSEIHELLFSHQNLKSFKPETLFAKSSEWQITTGGQKLHMSGPLGKILEGHDVLMGAGSTLEIQWYHDKEKTKKNQAALNKPVAVADKAPGQRMVEAGEQVNVGGIELQGYGVTRTRNTANQPGGKENPPQPPPAAGGEKIALGLWPAGSSNDKEISWLYQNNTTGKWQFKDETLGQVECSRLPGPKGGWQLTCTFIDTAGGRIKLPRVVYRNDDAHNIVYSRPLIKAVTPFGPTRLKHVLSEPKDAQVKVDGVVLKRDTNTDLKDLISGLSISLKKPSNGQAVLTIEGNNENGKDKVLKFVEAYNKLRTDGRAMTKTAVNLRPGDSRARREQSGMLSGDSTVRRLLSGLQTLTNKAYPSNSEPHIKLLPQIGISTGDVGANWSDIKDGFLVVDEEKLTRVLEEQPLGVKELFNSDNNGDGRIDDGVAHQFIVFLKPYTRYKGLLANRIELLNEQVKQQNDRIARHEDYLQKWETKTRQKFGGMERALKQSKSMSDYLKNNNPNRK